MLNGKGRQVPTRLTDTFRKEEDGAAIVMTLFFLISTLVVAGMAIDFMRMKTDELAVQSAADRGALAAAKLDHQLDPEDVVESYFKAGGIADQLNTVELGEYEDDFREVAVTGEAGVDTYFLSLAGMDSLKTAVQSAAIQGVGDIEISLVLDISYSMTFDNRIAQLREAALAFAQSALDPDHDGKISLNVVAYSGDVNVGPEMFSYLNGQRHDIQIEGYETPNDPTDDVFEAQTASSCLRLGSTDFNDAGLPSSGLDQTPHFYTAKNAIKLDAGLWCNGDAEIRYAQRYVGDPDVSGTLGNYLANLPLGYGTGTHIATKYGLALLDPSTQPAFDRLSDAGLVDEAFENRPLAYGAPGVQKVMVVMTDGKVWNTRLPYDVENPANADPATPVFSYQGKSAWYQPSNSSANVVDFLSVCDLAKAVSRDITVFTVAFDAPAAAKTQMRDCASTDAHFYDAANGSLTTVFEEIASQISDLRLTQ